MSLSAFQKKAGLIFAVAAFVLGVTAATALGWANEKNNKGKEHGKNETPPTVTTPTPAPPQQPQQVPTTPAPTPAPPAGVPPAPPVGAQTPPEQVTARGAPKQKHKGGGAKQQREQNVPAEVTPGTQTTLAPVVERKQLARTGLDPILMALLGAFCLAGGGLLFRRAVVR
jgi:hypothetical protein